MTSIIQGYTYDIFISYRQKDNKGERWVSEFVDALKIELESTFKEEISVYFDINPHDGLLETHDVDASLKEKLNCLIFIPIISRTYCDPECFAWKHEFLAFVEQASQDQFGLKVRLLNGNVASRVLPVRIHDLNNIDLRLCEQILEGDLRSVDFIYKTAGVNRPLRYSEDHPLDNINKIYYRDQINKVANAIDEIISSLKRKHYSPEEDNHLFNEHDAQNVTDLINNDETNVNPDIQLPVQTWGTGKKTGTDILIKSREYWSRHFNKTIFSLLITASIIILVFSGEGPSKFFGPGKSKKELARSYVSNAVDLINNGDLEAAKGELNLALENDPKNSYAWSNLAVISVRQGDLKTAILQTLEAIKFDPGNSYAAYNIAFALDEKKDYKQAIKWYEKSIELDSSLIAAYSTLGHLYNNLGLSVDAILLLRIAKDKYPKSDTIYLVYKNLGNAYLLEEQADTAIKYLEHSISLKGNEAETNLFLARAYEAAGQTARSIDQWQTYIELETDTIKIEEARNHLKEITIKHLQDIIK